ncbi:MAG: polysaccharide biosynthesis/export family protein [Bacteroidota bacterium]
MYLQSKNELDQDFRPDTVLRSYDLPQFGYRLKPEDILSIRVNSLTKEEFDFFQENQSAQMLGNPAGLAISGYLIDENGDIEFPVVGNIQLSGLTILEAQHKIQQAAQDFLTNPVVRVRLLNYRVTILGEVNQEGVIDIFNNRVTVTEVIGRGGGFTDLANRSNVKVIRQNDEMAEVAYVNLLDEQLLTSPYYYVQSNDIIIVEPLKQRSFRQYFGPNVGLLVSSISVLLLTLNLLNE